MSVKEARDAFLGWWKEQGGQRQGLRVDASNVGGLGAFAPRTLDAGTEILAIPHHLIYWEGSAFSTSVGKELVKRCPSADNRALFATMVALERAGAVEGSKHTKYFQSTPVPRLPVGWSEVEQEKHLSGTALATALRSRLDWLQEQHRIVTEGIVKSSKPSIPSVSWKEFLDAYCLYISRSFPYTLMRDEFPADGKLHAGILIPFADMLNHKSRAAISWQPDKGCVRFIVNQRYEKGEEVFNNYGAKPNEEFLMNFGFALKDNEFDLLPITLGILPNDPYLAKRLVIMALAGIHVHHYCSRAGIPTSLMAAVQTILLTPRDIDLCLRLAVWELLSLMEADRSEKAVSGDGSTANGTGSSESKKEEESVTLSGDGRWFESLGLRSDESERIESILASLPATLDDFLAMEARFASHSVNIGGKVYKVRGGVSRDRNVGSCPQLSRILHSSLSHISAESTCETLQAYIQTKIALHLQCHPKDRRAFLQQPSGASSSTSDSDESSSSDDDALFAAYYRQGQLEILRGCSEGLQDLWQSYPTSFSSVQKVVPVRVPASVMSEGQALPTTVTELISAPRLKVTKLPACKDLDSSFVSYNVSLATSFAPNVLFVGEGRTIKAGEPLLSCPLRSALRWELDSGQRLYGSIADGDALGLEEMPIEVRLALVLLHELSEKEDSKWVQYMMWLGFPSPLSWAGGDQASAGSNKRRKVEEAASNGGKLEESNDEDVNIPPIFLACFDRDLVDDSYSKACPQLRERIEERREELREIFEEFLVPLRNSLTEAGQEVKYLTWLEFLWAALCVDAFSIPIKTFDPVNPEDRVLLPLSPHPRRCTGEPRGGLYASAVQGGAPSESLDMSFPALSYFRLSKAKTHVELASFVDLPAGSEVLIPPEDSDDVVDVFLRYGTFFAWSSAQLFPFERKPSGDSPERTDFPSKLYMSFESGMLFDVLNKTYAESAAE